MRPLIFLSSIVFTMFISLYQKLTLIFNLKIVRWIFKYTSQVIVQRGVFSDNQKVQNENAKIFKYIHIIANCSISLTLSFLIINYHEIFIKCIIVISHHIHHGFISFVVDIPDYSANLFSSCAFKHFLCYLYLYFGYLGISAQIALTIDLIFICNYPTILIYKFLTKFYQLLIKSISILWKLLTRQSSNWLTFQHHSFFLGQNIKFIYLAALPILLFAIGITIFYYMWLATVIVTLNILMVTMYVFQNLAFDFLLLLEKTGSFVCITKGISLKNDQKQSSKSKIKHMSQELFAIEWINLIDCQAISSIFKGQDKLTIRQTSKLSKTTKCLRFESFADIFKSFSSMSK